jgi:ABC-2 type transport system permease protein/lipopolysaccharide transport system permease protein
MRRVTNARPNSPAGASDDGGLAEAPDGCLRDHDIPDAPPPELRYRRALRLGAALRGFWGSRHIVWSLSVRELRTTYNQEILGFAWALLAPLTMMVVFTFLFNRVGKVNSSGIPYPLFSYLGLLPWTFFSAAVLGAAQSLVVNPLLNKVYAPREVFPLAQVVTAAVSALCASLALAVLFVIEDWAPSATSYWAVPLIAILLAFTVAATLFFSAVTVYLRDLRHALPLMLQVGLFVTPVVYGLNEIPSEFRAVYVAVNPLAAVIDGLRQCVLLDHAPNMTYTLIAAASSTAYLLGTYLLFKRLETGFADVS